MSTLGPNFVARPLPTVAQLQTAFTAWFNALFAATPAQLANPGATLAPPLTWAEVQSALGIVPARVYVALLTQSGVLPPVPDVVLNTLGPVAFSFNGDGDYTLTGTGLFTPGKTVVAGSFTRWDLKTSADVFQNSGGLDADLITLKTWNIAAPAAPVGANGVLVASPLVITVYP